MKYQKRKSKNDATDVKPRPSRTPPYVVVSYDEGRRLRLERPPRAQRKSRYLPTDWPKVGGPALDMSPVMAFQSEAFLDAYEAGEQRICYAAGCPGLGALSRRVHIPAYKIGTCSPGREEQRFYELRRDAYGSHVFVDGDYRKEPGWSEWFPSHLHPEYGPSPGSPVAVEPRSLVVTLPRGMAVETFDTRYNELVAMAALDAWAMTEAAARHCAFVGVEPSELHRFTLYPGWRLWTAREIVGFSIFSGADRLIRIAEKVIAEHLGL